MGAVWGPVDGGTSTELARLVKRQRRGWGESACEERALCCRGMERGQRTRQGEWDLSLRRSGDRVATLGSLSVGGIKGNWVSRRT